VPGLLLLLGVRARHAVPATLSLSGMPSRARLAYNPEQSLPGEHLEHHAQETDGQQCPCMLCPPSPFPPRPIPPAHNSGAARSGRTLIGLLPPPRHSLPVFGWSIGQRRLSEQRALHEKAQEYLAAAQKRAAALEVTPFRKRYPQPSPPLPALPAPSATQAPALISLSATNAPPAATATRLPPALVGLPLSLRRPTASVYPTTGATTAQGSQTQHIALSLPTESAGPATSSPVPPSRVPASSPLVATIPAMRR